MPYIADVIGRSIILIIISGNKGVLTIINIISTSLQGHPHFQNIRIPVFIKEVIITSNI